MTATMTAPFNEYNQYAEELIERHLKVPETRLLLAIRYQPERSPGDVFLFEVLDNFGAGLVDEIRKSLFEVEFDSSEEFPMQDEHRLRMILTNPNELDAAIREQWALAKEVQQALHNGKSEVIFARAPEGKQILEHLRG